MLGEKTTSNQKKISAEFKLEITQLTLVQNQTFVEAASVMNVDKSNLRDKVLLQFLLTLGCCRREIKE